MSGGAWLRVATVSFVVLFMWAGIAEARVFDFKNERIATYFGGTFGPSSVGDTAYGASSGSDISVDKQISTNASGEIGLLLTTPKLNLKLGAELLLPKQYSDIEGTDAAGTSMFNLRSKIYALIPMATLEILAYQTPTSRLILAAGGGLAFVTLDNTYTMTSAGTTTLGVGDFTESASATVTALQVYTGYEMLFTDTVTAVFNLGYRHIPVPALKSSKATTAISGTQAEGDELKNMDGTSRSINLGGVFVGLSFRFYIGL